MASNVWFSGLRSFLPLGLMLLAAEPGLGLTSSSRGFPQSVPPSPQVGYSEGEDSALLPGSELDGTVAQALPQLDRPQIELPSQEPLEEPGVPQPLPAPEELLEGPGSLGIEGPAAIPGVVPETVVVSEFIVEGSTVFSDAELAEITEPYTNRELSFNQLFQVRSEITQRYAKEGYVTSAAIIPPQTFRNQGAVTIQIVEGQLEDIRIIGMKRLDKDYVRDRIARYADAPLQDDRLLEGLQLLQLDPLIEQVSAELSVGPRQGTSLLTLLVKEADTFRVDLTMDNDRSPTVGSFQHQLNITEANLLGNGEQLSVGYTHTSGLDSFEASYTYFLNSRNGTLKFSAGLTHSNVVEAPFELLDIESDSTFLEATWRQPLYKSPREEFAIGVTASRQESRSVFLENLLGDAIPFPATGANDNGRTRITALRFFQEWVNQGPTEVLAARSQFTVGLDILGATTGDTGPNSGFFAWRGQGQWVRLLAPETLLILQTDVQLADSTLVPLEQIGLGGSDSVRGYRQDQLLTDNAARLSAELRWPIYRSQDLGLVQLTPFVEVGAGWNNGASLNPDPNVLASLGLGVLWQLNDRINARLSYGIPLVSDNSDGDSLQDNGLHLSLSYRPF